MNLVSTANLVNLISTANLAGLVSTANLAGLVSTTYLTSQITSTVVGLGSAGYISSSQLVSTVAGISLTAGPTQTQVVSSINNLLVPYSTLNTATYFQMKASTNQLFFGTYGPQSQLYIGDLKAAYGDSVSTEPTVLINQPVIQQAVSFSSNYSYTGSDQTFVVPAGLTSMNVTLSGAGGGNSGGTGGYVSGTLAVTPGQTLTIIVGQGGQITGNAYGGGGSSGSFPGGSGGGRSAIRLSGNDIVTAGGGGCGAGGAGGNGGYPSGSAGSGGFPGQGGTSNAGGAGNYPNYGAGSQYTGGSSAGQSYGGGGGGGYYGGGAGGATNGANQGGGGGGSSYYSASLTNVTANSSGGGAASQTNGSVSISYNLNLIYRNANAIEIRGYQGNKMIVDPYMNMGIGVSSINSTISLDVVGTTRSLTMSTQQLNISSINGQTFGGPIFSTVIGLGTAGYVSTSYLGTQLASTVQGLGSAGYISSSQLLSTSAGLSGNSGPTQAQVTSSINNLLVPYSTLNTSTYFQVKASTNQLFFGNYFPPDSGSGPSAQIFIGDIKAKKGDATTIEPIVLINQPTVSPYVPTTNVSYPSIGAVSSFTVPASITSITVTLGGPRGGGGTYNYPGNSSYGWGDTVSGTLAVTPGETLTIIVGSPGAYAYETSAGTSAYGGGGIGGSQTSSTYGGGGGGRTAIQRGGVDIVTAGGGGGGQGGTGGYNGGNAAYDTGYQGGGGGQTTAATSSMGGGGSQTTGGSSPGSPSTSGSARTGGNSAGQGGGGGGGYYGGGGGYNGCGGGGSSYIANLTGTVSYNVNNTYYNGQSGIGYINITYGQSLVYRNANMLELRGYTGNKTIFDANMNLGINISSINTSYALDVGGAIRAQSLLVSSLSTTSLIARTLNTGQMTMSSLFISYSTLTPTTYFTISTTNTQLLIGTAGSNSQVYVGDIRSYFGDATSTNPIFTIQQTPLVTSATSNTVTYSYTGADQTFTVPNGITTIYVTLSGAAGQSTTYSLGGAGGYVSGTLAVTTGATYTVIVGGTNAGNATAYGGGGASGASGSASGGGRSAINLGGVDLVTAGGGGGGASTNNGGPIGGVGGGTTGGSGTSPALAGYAGTGGTQSSGGTGYYTGTQYSGGAANSAGGGGGGWWGGGGASYGLGGGGGGSSYVGNLTGTVVNTQGGGAAAGYYSSTGSQPGTVTISYYTGIAPRNANLFEVVAYNGNKFIVDSNASVGINTSSIVSSFTLDVNGPFRSAVYYSTITAGGTMTITPGNNFGVYYNITASGTYTISLDSSQISQNIGKYYVFRNNSGSSLSITITGGSGITSPITVATATTATIMVATTSSYALF